MTITNPCDTVDESGKWFGLVRWCDDDIAIELERCGIPVTEYNIDAVRDKLSNHFFTDYMISAGWDYIDNEVMTMKMEGALT